MFLSAEEYLPDENAALDNETIPSPEDLFPGNYPNYGCSNKINTKNCKTVDKLIGKLDIKRYSEYADAICRRFYNNKDFLDFQLENFSDRRTNITSVGNLAFLSLYAPVPYKESFKKHYDKILSCK